MIVPDLCLEHGNSSVTFYKWRSKFGGMEVSLVARMKELEEGSRRLKKMYAEALRTELLKEELGRNGEAISATQDGPISSHERAYEHPQGLPDLQGEPGRFPLLSQGCSGHWRRALIGADKSGGTAVPSGYESFNPGP